MLYRRSQVDGYGASIHEIGRATILGAGRDDAALGSIRDSQPDSARTKIDENKTRNHSHNAWLVSSASLSGTKLAFTTSTLELTRVTGKTPVV